MEITENEVAERYLTETEVANWLGLSKRTLQGWRLKGKGPEFEKFERSVRYSPTIIQTWIRTRERTSTSATAPVGTCNTPNCGCDLPQSKGDQ